MPHRGKVWMSLSAIRDCLAAELGQSDAAVGVILSDLPREPQHRKLRWDKLAALVLNGRLKLATIRSVAGKPLPWDDSRVLDFFRQRLDCEKPARAKQTTKRRGGRRRKRSLRPSPIVAQQPKLVLS